MRQPKKIGGETGIGTLAMSSATRAAKKGWRLMIAEMMIGCALLSRELEQQQTDHADKKQNAKLAIM